MKASDKLKIQIELKQNEIAKIKKEVEDRTKLLYSKSVFKKFNGFQNIDPLNLFNISSARANKYSVPIKYFFEGKEISKAEFFTKKNDFDELDRISYAEIQKLQSEINILTGALERSICDEAGKITLKNKNDTFRYYEAELNYIIKLVSSWEKIHGNYSQSKLAAKMNKPKWYLTRLFARKFTYKGIQRTFKEHLIEYVNAGIETARNSKYNSKDEVISRLNHFYDCLVRDKAALGLEYSDRKSSSKLRGRIKRQY